jgi:hypothetical protein
MMISTINTKFGKSDISVLVEILVWLLKYQSIERLMVTGNLVAI